jgi:hypothetical protein
LAEILRKLKEKMFCICTLCTCWLTNEDKTTYKTLIKVIIWYYDLFYDTRHDWPRSCRDALFRSVKGYTRLDKIRSKVIRKELEISGIQDVRSKHKHNWINHLERMDNTRLPKHALNYKPRPRSWTPYEKMATGRCRDRSIDLIHGGG